MRPLGDYDAFDWLRLRPVTHRWKSLRYDWINERHMLRPPRRGDLAALRERIGGRNLLVTIAFGDVEAIRWQTDLIAANVSGAVHLIADNTVEDGVAACIEAEAGRSQPIPWAGAELGVAEARPSRPADGLRLPRRRHLPDRA
jgi:hypothetical protein